MRESEPKKNNDDQDSGINQLLASLSTPDHGDDFWSGLEARCEAETPSRPDQENIKTATVASQHAGSPAITADSLPTVVPLRQPKKARRPNIALAAASVAAALALSGAVFSSMQPSVDNQELTSQRTLVKDEAGLPADVPPAVDEATESSIETRVEEETTTTSPPASTTTTTPPATVAAGESIGGQHGLTLHWLGTDERGIITLKPLGDERYAVSGRHDQPDGNGYLTIEGTITKINELELAFEGTIETQVDFLVEGLPCSRRVGSTFLSTQGRQYWRLQDVDSPCDTHVDYIDIYFD